ncbi:hypothetical protein FOXB_05126 [Fusarium oxysporum f. sp. conglutinans Fo5176]|uniref:Uncharacterized protein n=1 Tax=Fusarium oxysporum (strain Fo5176) TaxID=660025 RepID=F9FFE7_FUSOF|nr:hypothetical protein FOXB_05126 [Fusarium oxysporum f. sp. conglutinans Fo5176]
MSRWVSLTSSTHQTGRKRQGWSPGFEDNCSSNSNVWESILDQMNQVLGPLIMSSRGILLIGQRIQDVRMFSERQPSQHRHGQECTNALDVSAVEVDHDRGYYLVSAT